ncbi:Regulatory protein NPR5 [Platanthera zijinensis]|uniref:Regulatory protein NPR5 n=1 Tax=Platanthera zijinensis TaxID=2320716 RepID=A0AAP0G8B0_9ASPA
MEESLKSMSMDYLNLLINGQAFSDVTFTVDGRHLHAHRCILAARSLFFRKFFSGAAADPPPALLNRHSPGRSAPPPPSRGAVIPVSSVSYEVFSLLLQFLYSGQASVVPQKHEPRPNCGDRGCWHTHCSAAVDLALDTLAAARSFGVDQLALLTQKQLENMVEKASMEDVMKVLIAARQEELHHLWSTCFRLVANSGLPPEFLSKHLPLDVAANLEELRRCSSVSTSPRHASDLLSPAASDHHHQKIRRMRHALDSSDVELVRLMVVGDGLNLDGALALHYAVERCSREVVKALLELGAADVNHPAGPAGRTPLHVAAELVSPDMVAVLLDHHADPNARTADGVTPLDILRSLTSDFLFKGALAGPSAANFEPNKLRLCLELVQSAVMVAAREAEAAGSRSSDSKMVYLNLGVSAAEAAQMAGYMMDDAAEGDGRSRRPSSSTSHGGDCAASTGRLCI